MPIDFSTGIKIGDVDCFDQSTEETFDQFDSCATRTLACKWSDRKALINALNPQGTQLGGIYVFSSIPYPDFPALYPQRFRTKCYPGSKIVKAPSGMVGYDVCLLTAEYRPFRGGDPQGYLEFDLGANVITMPGSGTWLETDNDSPIDVPLQDCARGYPLAVIGICRGRSNVAGLDTQLINDIAAKPVNSKAFLNFAPGTVIFEGARARRQTLTNVGLGAGTSNPVTGFASASSLLEGAWDIEYRFQARPALPWDHLPFRKKVDNAFQFVLEKVRLKHGAGPYLGRSDLNSLFGNSGGLVSLS
ncbi:MAG TPA: hypothetical protein VF595_06185 [Tepidisphaeraceae bacterium]|jgi:hypothetical protein